MAKRSYRKKYKIISSFNYQGPDGKNGKPVRLGPGEEVPKLDTDELNYLLAREKIAEVSAETGETIASNKIIVLRDGEIDRFLSKSPAMIQAALKNNNFSTDTLSKIYIRAEKMKMQNNILTLMDEVLAKRVGSN